MTGHDIYIHETCYVSEDLDSQTYYPAVVWVYLNSFIYSIFTCFLKNHFKI